MNSPTRPLAAQASPPTPAPPRRVALTLSIAAALLLALLAAVVLLALRMHFEARDRALDEDADIRFRVKHDVPVFNRPFSQVAEEYAEAQQRRANAGEISQARAMNVRNKVNGPLNAYVGSTQVHLVTTCSEMAVTETLATKSCR